jgi:hypothetical protein
VFLRAPYRGWRSAQISIVTVSRTLADQVDKVETFRLHEPLRFRKAFRELLPEHDGFDGGEWIAAALVGFK